MKKMRKLFVSLFAVVLLLASCGGGAKGGANELKLATPFVSNSLNNAYTSEAVNFQIISNYLEGLLTYDKDHNLVGSMAETWDISKDGKTYTFNLREGLVWSNGTPLTAHDFVFGWQTLATFPEASYGNMIDDVKNGKAVRDGKKDPSELGVVAKDDTTLVVELEGPRPYFEALMAFAAFFPINEAFYNEIGGADAYGTTMDTVLANGPYKLTEYEPNLQYVMEKNADYWDADNVKLEKITTRIVEDSSTQASLYDSGEIDRLQLTNSDLMDQYGDSPDVVTQDESALFYMYLSGTTKTPDEVLNNKNFRTAVSYAIDKTVIAENILKNGSTGVDFIVPASFDNLDGKTFREYSGKHNEPKFNVETAQEYLAKAKEELGSETLEFEIAVSETEGGKKIYTNIQSQLQENLPGVTVKLKMIPQQNYYPTIQKLETPSGSAGWGADYVDVATYFSIYRSFDDHNYSQYTSEKYDSLVADAENYTGAERWDKFVEAEDTLLDDAVIIPIYQRGATTLLNPKVEGYSINSTSPDIFFKFIEIK